jgi:hypothetical protein
MDAHDFARRASLVAAERSVVKAALARFRAHQIGPDWRGRDRNQADSARESATQACTRALAALDDAEREALRLWRAALAATHPLGM